jgi:uncharacterized repeat protein (TIGR03803 family)
LHSFDGANDGESPSGGLVNVNGTMYGTTQLGGTDSNGTVFSITPGGTFTVLYSFQGGSDGVSPVGLTVMKGVLYGVTVAGGASNYGTIFSMTLSGTETVLHSFNGADGCAPNAALTPYNGVLYGTTTQCGGPNNAGTAFRFTP